MIAGHIAATGLLLLLVFGILASGVGVALDDVPQKYEVLARNTLGLSIGAAASGLLLAMVGFIAAIWS